METIKTYYGEAGRTVYPVDFNLGYLDRSHIYVYAGTDPLEQLAYSWLNANQIELVTPFTVGAEFFIRRITPRNELFNDYENGAILEERNLDDSFKQTLMVLEEWEEGSFPSGLVMANDIDMQGHRILNLPKPLLPHEPVRLQDVSIDLSPILNSGEGGLIRTAMEPTQADGWLWFDKADGLYVGDDNQWKPISGGTGGGITYVTSAPIEPVVGQTLYNQNEHTLGFSTDDGTSTQIVEYNLLTGAAYIAGGGADATTIGNATGTGNLLVTTGGATDYTVKRIKSGTNVSITDDGSALTINAVGGGDSGTTTTLSNAGSVGLGLVSDIVGNDYPIKRLAQGTGITITDSGTYYTISATGVGSGITSLVNAAGAGSEVLQGVTAGVGTFRKLRSSTGNILLSTDAESIDLTINTVDKSKVTNITASKLLGRATASTGAAEEITLGTNLTLVGTTLNATGGVADGDKGDIVVSTGGTVWGFDPSVITTFARTLLDDTTASAMRATLGAQPLSNTLSAMSPVASSADLIMYANGINSFAMTPFTALARTLLEKTSITAFLTALGIIVVTNANGVCLKFPTAGTTSGVQICFKTGLSTGAITNVSGAVFVGDPQQWDFPVAFNSAPAVTGMITSNAAAWLGGGMSPPSTGAAFFRGYSGVSGTTANVCMIAIGTY